MTVGGSRCCERAPRNPGRPTVVSWPQVLEALHGYQQRFGTIDVPQRIRAHGVELGTCVMQCRKDFWNGHLDTESIAALESIAGWTWGVPNDGSWRAALHAVAAGSRTQGSTLLLARRTAAGLDMQQWCADQRAAYSEGRLSAGQIQALEALPDWCWDPEEYRWRQGLAVLQSYVQSGGDLTQITTSTRASGFRLGQWLQRCRQDCRTGDLTDDRRADLDAAVPGWNCCPNSWMSGYQRLQRFIAQHGHAQPTQRCTVDGFNLGLWVTRQRTQRRRGTLSADHARALEALPGWHWNPSTSPRTKVTPTPRRIVQIHARIDAIGHVRINDDASSRA